MAHVQKRNKLLVKMLILDAAFESSRRAIRNNTLDNFSQPFGFLCTCQDTHFCLCECVFPPSLCRLKFIMTGRRLDVENESKARLKSSKTSCKVNFKKASFPRKTLDFLFLSPIAYSPPHSGNRRGLQYGDLCFVVQALNAIP